MDNVPSSAILAIVAIVAACLLGAFIFTTVQSQREAGNSAVTKTEKMNASLDESTYTQYDGATVTGSQVLAAIKALKGNQITIIVQVSETVSPLTFDEQNDKMYSVNLKDAKDKSKECYITPSAKFTGEIVRSDNGSIVAIKFTRVAG